MDTTPEYIKQCEKAEEIQEAWKPEIGDWYVADYSDKPMIVPNWNCVLEMKADQQKYETWLPRQDQLQSMVRNIPMKTALNSPYGLVLYLKNFAETDAADHCTSMEQLWLAFVMSEKYGKVWTGEKWEEADATVR